MTVAETDELQAQFKMLDVRQSGTIQVQDLVQVLRDRLGLSEDEATRLSTNLNPSQSQCLHYSDFLAAVTQRRILSQEAQIRQAFRRFDVDNSGFISVENLKTVLGDEFQGVAIEDMLNQVDHLQDGVIRYEEFLFAMMDLGSATDGGTDGWKIGGNISRAWEFTSAGARGPSQLKRRSWRKPRTLAEFKHGSLPAKGSSCRRHMTHVEWQAGSDTTRSYKARCCARSHTAALAENEGDVSFDVNVGRCVSIDMHSLEPRREFSADSSKIQQCFSDNSDVEDMTPQKSNTLGKQLSKLVEADEQRSWSCLAKTTCASDIPRNVTATVDVDVPPKRSNIPLWEKE
jgi:Ca2+-binding EF-hand superfamily protein